MNELETADKDLESALKTLSGKKAECYLEKVNITLAKLDQESPLSSRNEIDLRHLRYLESRYELRGDNFNEVMRAYLALQDFNSENKPYCSFIKFKESHLQLKKIKSPESVYNDKWDTNSLRFRQKHVVPAFERFTSKYAEVTDLALNNGQFDRVAQSSVIYIGESLRQLQLSACISGFHILKSALEAQKKNVPLFLLRTASTGLVGELRRISREYTYNLSNSAENSTLQPSNPLKF